VVHVSRLSAPPYELWVRGKLLGELGIRNDGRVRVEVIGGVTVASPLPTLDHAGIVGDIQFAVERAGAHDAAFPWRAAQNADFNLERIAEGYIPDLVVLDVEVHRDARKAKARFLTAEQLSMVVEVTSKWNAADDREPGPKRERRTKWNGYALVNVPYFLLVDRDPRRLTVTLYSEPDSDAGMYTTSRVWEFGEAVSLPEPFSVDVPTDEWEAWDED